MVKWHDKLDQLKFKFELKNDSEIAKSLGISRQAISKIRSGTTQPSIATKLIIYDKLGVTNLRYVILEILPDDRKALVINDADFHQKD